MRVGALGLTVAMGLSLSAVASADDFTAADVLEWDTATQEWYFHASITMAGIVATQNPTAHAECINDWYFSSDAATREANAFIIETMRRFPDHHPGTTLIAVLEKACGSFNFTE